MGMGLSAPVGTTAGAVYSPVELMNPNCAVPGLPGDFTPQVTAVEMGRFPVVVTAALNCVVPLT